MLSRICGYLQSTLVAGNRADRLAYLLASTLEDGDRVLDVGAGDGRISQLIFDQKPSVSIEGIDVLLQKDSFMPVRQFDGSRIPYEDNSFDVVVFVDVLHHTDNGVTLLREARRVAKRAIVIKDHTCDGFFAFRTLQFMDYFGNAYCGVNLPYLYWSKRRWDQVFAELQLTVREWKSKLQLYPIPASWLFERSLHFVAVLEPQESRADDHPIQR